ncbi:MAG TPA: lysophospholipid acyltransferase family protein [Kiritimatiellia bacterium]|jgi:putative hemolysin|nr:lysophospholipid acyltransferase family protein [Kiritimatiellia bacterium]HOR98128.1 lysophospholipid acyltransferase family protein [Kiritimatiellia bacterium]HPC48999.1 lysophospholipid acyltransferase family protein [Kiritimatiellia bacterium]HPK37359.1 lysophospholipid acyltransferase family protein [Kiritimatiellia bacterium]HPW75844.1 lysophospholipid acyltransferase family protein [Kiritimatiellia bacterium]
MDTDRTENQAPRIFELPVHTFHTRLLRLLVRIVKRPVESITGLRACDKIYARTWRMPKDIPFCDRALQAIGIRTDFSEADLARIPKEGAVVVVANHPFGGIEGIILLSLLRRVRPDVKAMANYLLGAIPEMQGDFILVDPFGSKNSAKANLRPLKESLSWLKEGHLLIVFPSGEVSSFDRRTLRVRDPAWSASIAALTRKTNATVVPMFFPGRNNVFFQIAGFLHPRFRTSLLPRQIANKTGWKITVRIGTPLSPKALEPFSLDDVQLIRYMRFRSYLLAERETHRTRRFISLNPPMLPADPIIAPVPCETLTREIASLPESCRLIAAGDFAVYIAAAHQIPSCLREIGRLRETTFRVVGEGTGNAIDLDAFDEYYNHLFMWNTARQEIVGSYRLGLTDRILTERGIKGLYTRTLFKFDERLMTRIPPAIEMGRSFIRTEYQKAYTSLFLLWKGISAFIGRNPHYRVLFGPVSITNEYREASRCMILASMRQTCMADELTWLVKPKFPPKPPRRSEWCLKEYMEYLNDIDRVADYVAEIEPDGKDIPVLLRQYLKLSGKLLAFNVDPDFSSVVDGLIMVDLSQSSPKTLRRYMGNEVAEAYFRYHGITESTDDPAGKREPHSTPAASSPTPP